jgi:hypothetical protein
VSDSAGFRSPLLVGARDYAALFGGPALEVDAELGRCRPGGRAAVATGAIAGIVSALRAARISAMQVLRTSSGGCPGVRYKFDWSSAEVGVRGKRWEEASDASLA